MSELCSPMGAFGRLPPEIRHLIWNLYLNRAKTPKSRSRHKRYKQFRLSLMRTSEALSKDVAFVLHDKLELNFRVGIFETSGILLIDQDRQCIMNLRCHGVRRVTAQDEVSRFFKPLPLSKARCVRMMLQVEGDKEFSDHWKWYFDWVQLTYLLEPFVKSMRRFAVVISLYEDAEVQHVRIWDNATRNEDLPDELNAGSTIATIALIPIARLLNKTLVEPIITITFEIQEVVIPGDFSRKRADGHDIEPCREQIELHSAQREDIVELWLYGQVWRCPDRKAARLRQIIFAEWSRDYEQDLVNLLVRNGVDLLAFKDTTFYPEAERWIKRSYVMMRAFNPKSELRRQHCLRQIEMCSNIPDRSTPPRQHDGWDESAWYRAYYSGIPPLRSPDACLVLSLFAPMELVISGMFLQPRNLMLDQGPYSIDFEHKPSADVEAESVDESSICSSNHSSEVSDHSSDTESRE